MRSNPRAAATAVNVTIAKRLQDEEKSFAWLIEAAIGESRPPSTSSRNFDHVPIKQEEQALTFMQEPNPSNQRPCRAAAVAANAEMTRQVKEEEQSFYDLPLSRKRKSAPPEPPAKRSRVARTNTRQLGQTTSKRAGKKRRQAAVKEASQVISVKRENANTVKQKMKTTTKTIHLLLQIGDQAGRRCEFCRKVANICALMHCTACRRLYHAKCLVHTFKPYLDEDIPIREQIESLRLRVPERRGNMFRCASCKAALIEFYESGGYLWECDCPTCSQPEKLISYRERKLKQMINDAEVEKQRKYEQKHQFSQARKFGTGKSLILAAYRSNPSSSSERMLGSSSTTDEDMHEMQTQRQSRVKSLSDEVTTEVMDMVSAGSKNEQADAKKVTELEAHAQNRQETLQDNAVFDVQHETIDQYVSRQDVEDRNVKQIVTKKDDPEVLLKKKPGSEVLSQQETVLSPYSKPSEQEKIVSKVGFNPVGEPERPKLSGDELVHAVRVQHDAMTSQWNFPLMCSRTSSFRESGAMKMGKCLWFLKKMPIVQCSCCDKQFNYAEFVHHTDRVLVKNVKNASEDPMPYLFVEHRNIMQHTPLDQFLPAMRSWASRHNLRNTPTKSLRSHLLQDPRTGSNIENVKAVSDATPAFVTRLRSLALFKRPTHRNDKTLTAARLSEPANLNFLAWVVCLPPKYVMHMNDGSLADRVTRSKSAVPADAFPRKTGWLAFNREALTARHITCLCCEKSFNFDHFAEHTGIVLSELKQRSRQVVYVVGRPDESMLMPFNTFAPDLDIAAKENALDKFLSELRSPSSCT